MNFTSLLSFSAGLLGTFYLYFLSAKRLRLGRLVGGIGLGLLSVVTGALCLYSGVLTIRPVSTGSFFSIEIARSVFHIEVWPWLVPISAMCISILWLIGHALHAFTEHATKRGLGLSVAAVACLVPLGYSMFILSFFAIFTGAPKSETELIAAFELSTGFDYPSTATIKQLRTFRSDSFGDWEGAIVFQAPALTLDTYHQLSPTHWEAGSQWQMWRQEYCCDWESGKFPEFSPHNGATFVVGDEVYYKFLAIDHRSGTVYFLRSNW